MAHRTASSAALGLAAFYLAFLSQIEVMIDPLPECWLLGAFRAASKISMHLNLFTLQSFFKKTPRFLRYLIILLAFWIPLDNAVAGAVIVDCPLMSHAFEQVVAIIINPALTLLPTPPSTGTGAMLMAHQHSVSCPADSGCDHCSVCLLLGASALPSHYVLPLFAVYPVHYSSAAVAQAPLGVHTLPFRPPIV
jgi:hypothetical protein